MARAQFYITEQLSKRQGLTPEGFLLCEEVPIARTGMMIYGPGETPIEPGPDGIVKIFRDENEVFRPETLASILGKPITDDHPDEDVTPGSWRELAQGVVVNVRRGEGTMDDLLLADFLITTQDGIEAVQSGKREVSLGYDADYEEVQPGVGKQSNILVNHVALVESGRCGKRCAIRDQKPETDMAKNNITRLIRRAFKAKDEAELEKIEEEAHDELGEEKGVSSDEEETHLHIHGGMDDEGEEGLGLGRTTFTDDDIQEFISRNDSEHQDMYKRIGRLEEALEQLMEHEQEEEFMDEMAEEIPEEPRDSMAKARDSAFMRDTFQNVVAMAEILAPGVKIPTFDSARDPKKTYKSMCKLRRRALNQAAKTGDTSELVKQLVGNKDLKQMSCGAVRTLFNTAVSLRQGQNNGLRTRAFDATPRQSGKITSLADLNARMREQYKK